MTKYALLVRPVSSLNFLLEDLTLETMEVRQNVQIRQIL